MSKTNLLIASCIIFLNVEATCCCDELGADNVKSKLTSLVFNTCSAALGAVVSLDYFHGESVRGVTIACAGMSTLAAAFKGYNGYCDWKNGNMKGSLHLVLNGLIVSCNVSSAIMSTLSASGCDTKEVVIYNFASSLANIAGLGFKGLDLYISTPPTPTPTLVPPLNLSEVESSPASNPC